MLDQVSRETHEIIRHQILTSLENPLGFPHIPKEKRIDGIITYFTYFELKIVQLFEASRFSAKLHEILE